MSERDEFNTEPERAAHLLREYCDHREHFRMFDDFDSSMAAMQSAVDENLNETREPLRTVAQRLFKITRDAFFLIQVCEWKTTYVAKAVLHAIETRNPLSLANNTRAIIEHVAALVFILDSLGRLRKSLQGQVSEKAINKAIAKTEAILHRAFYGKSPKAKGNVQSALHIDDYLRVFAKYLQGIGDAHDFLCEYVHPNHGSNILVSTGDLGAGRLNPPPELHQGIIDRISEYCCLTLLFLREQAVPISANLMHLKDLVDRCFIQNAKISSVFSKKAALPEGNGQSKETAFSFPKARTLGEALDLTEQFLNESGIEVIGSREKEGPIDDFIYDIYHTSVGRLWFKIPMMKVKGKT